MSSVDGTHKMTEMDRRAKLLAAPVGERVERMAELAHCLNQEGVSEDAEASIREELWVVGATIVSDVLSALVRGADALESLAKDSRAHACASSVSSFTDGEKP